MMTAVMTIVMTTVMTWLHMINNDMILLMTKTAYKVEDTYSKYPTKDKKYECRTGLFKGFFVSSVEFCKMRYR